MEGEDQTFRPGLGEKKMAYVENYFATVPDQKHVVFFVYVPWVIQYHG